MAKNAILGNLRISKQQITTEAFCSKVIEKKIAVSNLTSTSGPYFI